MSPNLLQPRSAYVHVPFCRHRCGYCNFTLVAGREDLIPAYLEALGRELEMVLVQPTEVETLFLGGGTPSYLPPIHLQAFLRLLQHWLPLANAGEFSCEMNPLDCTSERLAMLQSAGVNRVSLGGQSFQDSKLALLERDHRGEQLDDALRRCSEWFANVSLDLIFAAPGELAVDWRRDLDAALNSPINHLSTYGLTIEKGAAFYGRVAKQELREVDEDLQLAMYALAIERTAEAGWEHYEVSNFCLPGFRCRHNEAYWLGRPWFAFGPGAASYLPKYEEPGHFLRAVNHRSSTTYIRKLLDGSSPIAERDELDPEQVLRERVVFGLRRLEGISLTELDQEFARDVRGMFEPFLSRYLAEGWLQIDTHQQLQLTPAGLVVSDGLWPDLLAMPL